MGSSAPFNGGVNKLKLFGWTSPSESDQRTEKSISAECASPTVVLAQPVSSNVNSKLSKTGRTFSLTSITTTAATDVKGALGPESVMVH